MDKNIIHLKVGDTYVFHFEQNGSHHHFIVDTMVSMALISLNLDQNKNIVPTISSPTCKVFKDTMHPNKKFYLYDSSDPKDPAIVINCVDGSLGFERLLSVE